MSVHESESWSPVLVSVTIISDLLILPVSKFHIGTALSNALRKPSVLDPRIENFDIPRETVTFWQPASWKNVKEHSPVNWINADVPIVVISWVDVSLRNRRFFEFSDIT